MVDYNLQAVLKAVRFWGEMNEIELLEKELRFAIRSSKRTNIKAQIATRIQELEKILERYEEIAREDIREDWTDRERIKKLHELRAGLKGVKAKWDGKLG
jgi:uncharacterized protein YwgA